MALVRIEQFYPFPEREFEIVRERYSAAREIVWAQEESENRGGWTYMMPRLMHHFPELPIRYLGRRASASPATGSLRIHQEEQRELVKAVFGEGKAREPDHPHLCAIEVGRSG